MTMPEQESVHDAVGAYALGVLDDADASAFEEHLAGCDICAAHLDEFAGMEPMLAMLAEVPPPAATPGLPSNAAGLPGARFGDRAAGPPEPRPVPVVPRPPRPAVLDGLLDEVALKRAARRRRGMLLVAAAAALIIGGPLTVLATTDGDPAHKHTGSPARDSFFHDMDEKITATDATTRVKATVGTEKKGWGTHAVLQLENVKGPLKCRLVAVSKTGEEEVVTSWSVPRWGYGIEDSGHRPARDPLYVHGGAAMQRADIDRFEVRTFDGRTLVEVDAA
ncbi:zf-HC2 domain-containing protein [Streptomyces yaizuensis]|uniref:Zf-HC2 domain-containing protein n=1 Tax=Streptomyces yaizuensis TaxID=2989713 RepID=A0ABQ5NSV5_9ACTN|nr:zf-HC2 domain-containing protein [Streptomyces sp. YSPA8]GLF93446.1 zf-HC2 domain-containing protein [Streptomyces sp. YSPA8]